MQSCIHFVRSPAVARFATIGCEYRMKVGVRSLEIYSGYRLIASDWHPHPGKD